MRDELEHYKQLAREANKRGDTFLVCRIIGLHLVPPMDQHDANRFLAELARDARGVWAGTVGRPCE
jgi:hypothetical protein